MLLGQVKSESCNFAEQMPLPSAAHLFVKLHFYLRDSHCTLTVIDVSTSNELQAGLAYISYILKSMHKSQASELKKSAAAKEFHKAFCNSKIQILNFAETRPTFLKTVPKDVLYPLVRMPCKDKSPSAIGFQVFMSEIRKI